MTVRFQPGFGWKLTKKRPFGRLSTTLVVSAVGRSVGTRIANREKLSTGTSFGLTVTWAVAAGTASSAPVSTSMVRVFFISEVPF